MSEIDTDQAGIHSAEILLPGKPFSETLAFFTDDLGFRVDTIYPADGPRVAVISGYGIRICLDQACDAAPGTIRLRCNKRARRTAPNGTIVELVKRDESPELPSLAPALVVVNATNVQGFAEGRAGMQYRDLIPGRYGGRFIASHIRIEKGGPVADYVHHHHILFQLIFCVRGWVSVVYEDQGPPMRLEPGDCFLQPPHIRHRVLESSDNMEVVEIACPAEHETAVDHDMKLPTGEMKPHRQFDGQRFVYHKYSETGWAPWVADGFEQQDTGVEHATGGIVTARFVRADGSTSAQLDHDGEIRFLFVLQGRALLDCGADKYDLERTAACAIPAGVAQALRKVSDDFRMLEVFVPSR